MPPTEAEVEVRLLQDQLRQSEWNRRLLERRIRAAVARTRHPAYKGRPDALVAALVKILTLPEAT